MPWDRRWVRSIRSTRSRGGRLRERGAGQVKRFGWLTDNLSDGSVQGDLGELHDALVVGLLRSVVDRTAVLRAADTGRLSQRLSAAQLKERRATAPRGAAGTAPTDLNRGWKGWERRLQDMEGRLAGGNSGFREELPGVCDKPRP